MNKPSAFVTCLATLAFSIAPAFANDWYQWRGPEQDGVSRETHLPEKWSPDGENLVWKNDIGGMSSPIVMDGMLYTITRVGEVPAGNESSPTLDPGPQTQEAVIAVDIKTGKVVWQHLSKMYVTDDPFHRLGWSNCAGDPKTGHVYALGAQNELVCLDGKTGKPIWNRQMMEEFGMITTFGGRTPSPTVDEDQVFITGVSFGWGDNYGSTHRIYAFDKATGELNWTAATPGIPVDAPYGTPVIGVVNGERVVVFNGGNGGIHCFQARSGKHLWTFQASKRGMNCSPIIQGNLVYASWDLDNFANTKLGGVVCLDASQVDAKKSPKVVWRQDGIEAGFPSLTIWDDVLYVPTDGAVIYAFDAKTGDILWHKGYGTIGKASLVAADGKLYFPEANGRMWILKIKSGKNRPEVLSHVDLEKKLGREYTIFGSVAIANGQVFLQAANETYCIGAKEPTTDAVKVPALAEESKPDSKPAVLQVRPADVLLWPGKKQTFTVMAFDAHGASLGESKEQSWSVGQLTMPVVRPRPKELMRPNSFSVGTGATPPPTTLPTTAPATTMPGAGPSTAPTMAGNLKGEVDKAGAFTAAAGGFQGGAVVASAEGLTGQARVRVLPALPWKIDFEQYPLEKPPFTWIGAGMKFSIREVPNQTKGLVKLTDIPLFARARTYFGAPDMHDYTMEADVSVKETVYDDNGTMVHKVPDVGIINSRYILELKGSKQTLGLHSWPAALPRVEEDAGLATHLTIGFPWKAGTWYHEKLSVTQEKDGAVARGKVWPVGENEPKDWTIELKDSTPNRAGAPGLWGFSNDHEIYYDNIVVTSNAEGSASAKP